MEEIGRGCHHYVFPTGCISCTIKSVLGSTNVSWLCKSCTLLTVKNHFPFLIIHARPLWDGNLLRQQQTTVPETHICTTEFLMSLLQTCYTYKALYQKFPASDCPTLGDFELPSHTQLIWHVYILSPFHQMGHHYKRKLSIMCWTTSAPSELIQ